MIFEQYFIDRLYCLARRVGCAGLVLALLAFAGRAQDTQNAILVDEFSDLFCSEDLRSKIDSFFVEIQDRPEWSGYVIGNFDTELPGRFEKYFELFHNHARFRKFPIDRVKLVRGAGSDATRFQLWVAPPGSQPPEGNRDHVRQKVKVATLFDTSRIHSIRSGKVEFGEWPESVEPCDFGLNLTQFAEAINPDPDVIGYLVAVTDHRGRGWARRAINLTKSELSRNLGVANGRIKHVYAGKRKVAEMQLWLVPKGAIPPKFRAGKLP